MSVSTHRFLWLFEKCSSLIMAPPSPKSPNVPHCPQRLACGPRLTVTDKGTTVSCGLILCHFRSLQPPRGSWLSHTATSHRPCPPLPAHALPPRPLFTDFLLRLILGCCPGDTGATQTVSRRGFWQNTLGLVWGDVNIGLGSPKETGGFEVIDDRVEMLH